MRLFSKLRTSTLSTENARNRSNVMHAIEQLRTQLLEHLLGASGMAAE